jgi:hypothetical protein
MCADLLTNQPKHEHTTSTGVRLAPEATRNDPPVDLDSLRGKTMKSYEIAQEIIGHVTQMVVIECD